MARSERSTMRPKIRLQSDHRVSRLREGRCHDAPRASRPRRLRRCAARSLDPCSRRGLTALMRRRTPSSPQATTNGLVASVSLIDGGVQIRLVSQHSRKYPTHRKRLRSVQPSDQVRLGRQPERHRLAPAYAYSSKSTRRPLRHVPAWVDSRCLQRVSLQRVLRPH
jgi:hypothetical protein